MGLLPKKVMNFAYGMGAAVVIVGALFKLMHWPFASAMLIVGLLVEAAIFALSSFDNDEELDWTLVYPELGGGDSRGRSNSFASTSEEQGLLSQKLDELLKDAKIDADLMQSLGSSIKNFEGAAKSIAPTVDAVASTKKYSEEMTLAASQLESLNNLYKAQLESANKNVEINNEVAANNLLLKDQNFRNYSYASNYKNL